MEKISLQASKNATCNALGNLKNSCKLNINHAKETKTSDAAQSLRKNIQSPRISFLKGNCLIAIEYDPLQTFFVFCRMPISINTPALFFPAISLVMLAYTNRFLALASVVRSLRARYSKVNKERKIHGQIKNLKYRLRLIKNMQAFGVVSFLCCIFSMYFIYVNYMAWANLMFGLAMVAFIVSLIMSLIEIQLSTKALELELSDIEDLHDPSVIDYLKKKFDRE